MPSINNNAPLTADSVPEEPKGEEKNSAKGKLGTREVKIPDSNSLYLKKGKSDSSSYDTEFNSASHFDTKKKHIPEKFSASDSSDLVSPGSDEFDSEASDSGYESISLTKETLGTVKTKSYSPLKTDATNPINIKQLIKNERILAKTCKDLPCYITLSKAFTRSIFNVFQRMYGEKDGLIKFCGEALADKQSTTGASIPKYAATNHPGWNPSTIVKTIKEGNSDQLNTLTLFSALKGGFKTILEKLFTEPETPKHKEIIQEFFSPEEFSELSKRYHKDPENFQMFDLKGWHTDRNSIRIYQTDDKLPKQDLKELYKQGKIGRKEMIFHLTNPEYGADLVLDGQGSYDIEKTLETVESMHGVLDIGGQRNVIIQDTAFQKEVLRQGTYAVSGPSCTTFRFLKLGQLLSPTLTRELNNIPNEQLMELIIPQCIAYVVPDDHSVIEIEMAGQDTGILDPSTTLETGRNLFNHDIQYGPGENDRINQMIFNQMLDENMKT